MNINKYTFSSLLLYILSIFKFSVRRAAGCMYTVFIIPPVLGTTRNSPEI